jgi:NAD(P)-dependent dehydrogenase (short-subunit alcohol dehydrogenase family)
MQKKVVLITGATDGIGKQTALDLAAMSATVIVHGRTAQRARDAAQEIQRRTGNKNVDSVYADFSSLSDVRHLAADVKAKCKRLHVLINNAGVYMKERRTTNDGFEMTFAVNHLAPFLLTNLLLDLLKHSTPARIINLSSIAHTRAKLEFDNLQGEKQFDAYGAYALSKLGNVLFTNELAERLNGTNVTVNAVHPGVITTKLLRAGFSISGSSVGEGAETSVYLASSPLVENVTGKYFVKKSEENSSAIAQDSQLRKKFWEVSCLLVGLSQP